MQTILILFGKNIYKLIGIDLLFMHIFKKYKLNRKSKAQNSFLSNEEINNFVVKKNYVQVNIRIL